MSARAWIAVALIGSAASACRQPGAFSCEDDQACAGGRCEAEGFCSFFDETCDSGRRFGDHAGDGLAGTCVASGDDDGGGASTSTGAPGDDHGSSLPPLEDTGPMDTTTGTSDGDGSTGVVNGCDGWWDCAWPIRVPIEVTEWSGPALEGVPIRVALTSERFDFTASLDTGADVRVIDDAGRPLPFEIEAWDAGTSQAELWVRVPVLENGARLWLYHGNLAAEPAEAPATVFTRDYLSVWHLGPELEDATGAVPLIDAGSSDAVGRIGHARAFDGTSDYVRVGSEADLLDVFVEGATVSAWIAIDTFGQGSYGRIFDHASQNTTIDGWSFSVSGLGFAGTVNTLRFAYGYTIRQGDWRPVATIEPGTWHHVAVSYVAGDVATVPQFYVDGVPITDVGIVEVAEGMPNLVTTVEPAIGALGTGGLRFFDGMIDELRISGVVRSVDWIAAEYASDTDALLSFRPPEYAP